MQGMDVGSARLPEDHDEDRTTEAGGQHYLPEKCSSAEENGLGSPGEDCRCVGSGKEYFPTFLLKHEWIFSY